MRVPREQIRTVIGAAMAVGLAVTLGVVLVKSFWPERPGRSVRDETGGATASPSPATTSGLVLPPVELPTR
jgi:hypothetical protein